MDNNKLFVGSLSWTTTAEDLRATFGKFGEITDAVVITDSVTGRSRGFGFISFSSADEANNARDEMDGQELDGRQIVVNEAKQRQDRRPRPNFLKKRD